MNGMVSHVVDTYLMLGFVHTHTQKKKEKKRNKNQRENITINYVKKKLRYDSFVHMKHVFLPILV